jgi:hypothetical protein
MRSAVSVLPISRLREWSSEGCADLGRAGCGIIIFTGMVRRIP